MDEYCECGEQLYTDCFGELRCESCDPPCPGCYDGGGPGDSSYLAEELETQSYMNNHFLPADEV